MKAVISSHSLQTGVSSLKVVGLLTAALILSGLHMAFKDSAVLSDLLPMRYVRIQGEFIQLDPRDVQQVIRPLVQQQGMLLDLEKVKRISLEVPWVANVKLHKLWPDTLVVDLVEHQAVARWGMNGLIDETGEAFYPKQISQFNNLPAISGPEGWQAKLYTSYRVMQKALADVGLVLINLSISERLAWTAHLSEDIHVAIGREQPVETFMRWINATKRFESSHIAAIETVDLRYPSGFAVRWKTGKKPGPKQLNRYRGRSAYDGAFRVSLSDKWNSNG